MASACFSCLRATLSPAVFHPQRGSQTTFAKYSLCQRTASIQTFSKNLEHIRILVADICTSKYKRYYLASVIARKVEFKAMAPTHCSFSVSGNSLEYLIGIAPEIMVYGYHRGINECYACTSSESSQIKEEHELEEFHLLFGSSKVNRMLFT